MLAHDADLELFRDNFRRFMLDHIEPFYSTWEKEGIMPREVWNKLGENGYLCVDMPEEYGGYGVPVHYSLMLVEEAARAGYGPIWLCRSRYCSEGPSFWSAISRC